MTVNAWARQFAIQMPNGELYCQEIQVPMTDEEIAASEDLTMPGPQRDMLALYGAGMFGYTNPQIRAKTVEIPVMFEKRADAEKLAGALAEQAAKYGVEWWAGSVVERLCTPFTSADPAVQFRDAVIAWSQQQQGSAS